jgi:hypothetical protein
MQTTRKVKMAKFMDPPEESPRHPHTVGEAAKEAVESMLEDCRQKSCSSPDAAASVLDNTLSATKNAGFNGPELVKGIRADITMRQRIISNDQYYHLDGNEWLEANLAHLNGAAFRKIEKLEKK